MHLGYLQLKENRMYFERLASDKSSSYFVKRVIELAQERDIVDVVNDLAQLLLYVRVDAKRIEAEINARSQDVRRQYDAER
tara:strand:- start:325 stop:567 length:243 start_codon:yes stop_codon:yes gene_type:complete